MKNEEPIVRIPIYTEIEGCTVEGSLLVFDEYLELRKVVKPNKKYQWDEIEKIDIKYDILPWHKTKQHNGLAATANILNMLDYTLTGQSIGYQHQGYTTQMPYILLYQESINIRLVKSESDKKKPFSILNPPNYLYFRYVRENQDGNMEYDKETKQRIADIDNLKKIIDEIMEEKKRENFNKWRKENVKTEVDFNSKSKKNDFDKWCEETLKKQEKTKADKKENEEYNDPLL